MRSRLRYGGPSLLATSPGITHPYRARRHEHAEPDALDRQISERKPSALVEHLGATRVDDRLAGETITAPFGDVVEVENGAWDRRLEVEVGAGRREDPYRR